VCVCVLCVCALAFSDFVNGKGYERKIRKEKEPQLIPAIPQEFFSLSVNAIMWSANASGLSFRNISTSLPFSLSFALPLSLSLSLSLPLALYSSHTDKSIKAKYS